MDTKIMERDAIAKRIRKLMVDQAITPLHIQNELNISQSSVSNRLNAKFDFSPQELEKLVPYLKTTMDFLLFGGPAEQEPGTVGTAMELPGTVANLLINYEALFNELARLGEKSIGRIHIIEDASHKLYVGEVAYRVYTSTGLCFDIRKEAIYRDLVFCRFIYPVVMQWGGAELEHIHVMDLLSVMESMR